ncbi:THAP domain-containing protein 5 isoform X2 [Monomorium pharaonis]|uniref:THAP domain-containing protein 5 isoform X2 n=1 Tax=Monomorium pharaonis TaxID=307658 RepID=UPI00063F1868|nr:THAP domain-containing protein 5 isoform X2 [Monomorium pharaonis]
MTRVCICCNYRMSKDKSLSDVSFFGFPKSDKLLKRWLHVIGTEKKITTWSRICSRHFKEDDFRYSVVGGKRYLKHEVVPSLCLNEKNKDDTVLDKQDTIVKENQPTNTVVACNMKTPESKVLDVNVKLHMEAKKDDKLAESLNPESLNEPEKKRKKYLYDVRWEEISTSSVQAKIYWEVVIKKITQQKHIVKSLRQRVRRLEKQISDLQTLIKDKEITDT